MTRSRKLLEQWKRFDDEQRRDPVEGNFLTSPCTSESAVPSQSGSIDVTFKQEEPWDTSSSPKYSWQAVGEPDAPIWKLSGTRGTSALWEMSEAPLPHHRRVCNDVHPKQQSPFPDRLNLPYLDEEILSGYEKDVSFIRDVFIACVTADFETILELPLSTLERLTKNSAMHLPENMILLIKSTISTTTCPAAHLYRKAEHLQLEPRTPTWKRRLYRETNRREMTHNHLARGD